MTHIICMLTAKNRDQLRNPTLDNRVWATFTFLLSQELLKVTIVSTDGVTNLPHHPPSCACIQPMSRASRHWCYTAWLPVVHIPNHLVNSYESHSKRCFISKKISNFWPEELSSCSWEYSRQLTAEDDFLILHSIVATCYRWGKQKHGHLCQISSGFRVPKLIKIDSFLTELFKK